MVNLFRLNLLIIFFSFSAFNSSLAQTVLTNAFAHNDYKHKRPLLDALNYGVANIEADIFLYKNKLVVAHFLPYFRKNKTLENLYLKPLLDRFALQDDIYSGYSKPIILMIDVKTNASKTYLKLKEVLEKYQSILTSYDNGVITERAVTVVISGNKPYELMEKEDVRFAFIDDDLKNMTSDSTNNLCLMASAKYSKITSWNGKQPISILQKLKLCNFIKQAHTEGKKVRLWAIPQNPMVWKMLMDCGIDLINSDNLEKMRSFFAKKHATPLIAQAH
ncbi:phosphatidylinositol-specific phospholipase C/glycerophosphodiester phosphodiesterase family protein [Mucilaginibacter sp.]|jgi:hypothetical protein|uniref:phosphatidylinositol-specific phospholipase C/glycerophosphodiester phosphodiesterase family protein n=1 Tax=Mucilaginibacter sp. TaxID=1882438 RepID=UPI0035620B13